ncbi:MAG: fasciclin domain-containing protein [Actinomycetota bacterium]
MLAAGCGDSDEPEADGASASGSASEPDATTEPPETTPPSTSTAASSGAFPVTLEQAIGPVTIEAEPTTVVTVDLWSLDFLDELDIAPVAAYTFGPAPGWLAAELDGLEVSPLTGPLPFEEIAAAGPDLIVDSSGFFTVSDPDAGSTLSAIAPLLSPPDDALSDGWRERFLHIAAAVGRVDEASSIIAATDDVLASIAAEFPELAGAAVTFARWNEVEATIDIVVDESDFTRRFLNEELGLTTPPDQQAAFDDGAGEALGGTLNVSVEQAELVGATADAVVMFTTGSPEALLDDPVWSSLDVVTEDRVVYVGLDGVFAVRTPSPKAIDHLVSDVLPPLAAAVSGAGASSAGNGDADGAGGGTVVDVGAAAGATLITNFASFSPDFFELATGDGPVTVFLPDDGALAAAQATDFGAALQADLTLLDEVLRYHAVADVALTAEDVIAAGEIGTLLGEPITVTVDGDSVVLNDGQATVAMADLAADNGIAHLIDGVLIPPSRAAEFTG